MRAERLNSVVRRPITCVLAISGGVDSVVLLDKAVQGEFGFKKGVVAHFDHGIRSESKKDAQFVKELAQKYGLRFESKREELGKKASEELARNRRYIFLRTLAKEYKAKVVTAHHADDVVETVAINLTRGTGWRGLAVLDSDIYRPMLNLTKQEIKKYAQQHNLSWREDSTNASSVYLRNYLRRKINRIENDIKRQICALRDEQCYLKQQIDTELQNIFDKQTSLLRHFFIQIDEKMALECLRYLTKSRLTKPQLVGALHAVKTLKPGKFYQAGNGVVFHFSYRYFTVEMIK
jgi:tRNA(Ile)-lysidine synthase